MMRFMDDVRREQISLAVIIVESVARGDPDESRILNAEKGRWEEGEEEEDERPE